MDRQTELRIAKRRARGWLLAAAALFTGALLAPPSAWRDALKAMAEAAMVGGLADWFAVSALFRRIPLPVVGRHTDIIPRNKDRIGDNLADFVREKFLDTGSIVALIRRHDPAGRLALWLMAPENAETLGRQLLTVARGLLSFVDDSRIQRFIKHAVHALLDKVDLSRSVATMLDGLTQGRRHQALLDQGIARVMALLAHPDTRAFISQQIVQWLKREHPLKEKVLPTEWLGEHGAELIANAVGSVLDEMAGNDAHVLREHFDRLVTRFIARLKQDPEMARRAEAIKDYLKNDAAFNGYIAELWGSLRDWLRDDLAREDSSLHARVVAAGEWLGKALAQDPALRASLNDHLEEAAARMAPDFADFLTRHISDTVKGWDVREMSHQIELNIGKDLQYIRINGTLVGGSIGLGLYLLTQGVDWLRQLG